MSHEHIEQAVASLGRGIAEDAIVIGSSAIACALPEFRSPNDVDIAIPEAAFNHLRQQPDWEEKESFDGTPRLVKETLDVGMGWGDTADYDDLRSRSWVISNLLVAGLPDTYAYKHRRRQGNDVADMQAVQAYLHNPNRGPFLVQQIPHEFAAALNCLPIELQDHPDAARAALLAANGMHIVYTLYGHPEIRQANQIIGELEEPEFGVPALYHNGFGLLRDARALQQHLANISAPTHDRLLALAIDPYTDADYGGGRFKDRPLSHDELRSARLLKSHALQLDFDPNDAQRMYNTTLDTTFDEATKSQRGKHAADPLARSVAGVDLYPLATPESLDLGAGLGIEDGFSKRAGVRTIGKVLMAHGVQIHSTVNGIHAIDRHASEKPADAPDGPTVMEAYANWMIGNGRFQRSHQYPDGWTLDNPSLRAENGRMSEQIGADLLAGKTAAEAYLVDIKEHTARMRERYGEGF